MKNSFPRYKKYRIVFVCLYLLTASLGIICYEVFTFDLGRISNLMPYAEQICGQGAQAIEQYDTTGISIIGVVDENNQYKLIGFLRSPFSGRYKEDHITYEDHESPEVVLHGVMCVFRTKGFFYSFEFYEMSDDNVSKFASSRTWYPIAIKQNSLMPVKHLINNVEPSVFILQVIPYAIICGSLLLIWALLFRYATHKKMQKM